MRCAEVCSIYRHILQPTKKKNASRTQRDVYQTQKRRTFPKKETQITYKRHIAHSIDTWKNLFWNRYKSKRRITNQRDVYYPQKSCVLRTNTTKTLERIYFGIDSIYHSQKQRIFHPLKRRMSPTKEPYTTHKGDVNHEQRMHHSQKQKIYHTQKRRTSLTKEAYIDEFCIEIRRDSNPVGSNFPSPKVFGPDRGDGHWKAKKERKNIFELHAK